MWRTVFRGVELEGDSHVYRPAEDTLLIASVAEGVDEGCSALDIGTGSGVLAILLGRRGVYAVGTDISWEALAWASRNVIRNGVDGYVDLVLADGYEAFRCGFGLVLINPPYLPGDPSTTVDSLFLGGEGGVETLLKILDRLRGCGSEIYVVVSSLTSYEGILERYGGGIVDKMDMGGEELLLLRLRP